MIAIIPARGGSKGLPGKNIKKLLGKPLIAYTIESAKAARGISQLIISTDKQEIAETAVQYGAECPFMRPAELASDTAKSIDTYLYTMAKMEEIKGTAIEHFMVLQPTSPLRNSQHIDEAIQLFQSKKADSVVSYVEEAHPINWHRYLDESGRIEDVFTDHALLNRQDYRKTYYPNGAIYIFNHELVKKGKYYSEKSFAYVMDKKYSVDIDTQEDFEYAEHVLRRLSAPYQ
ncbi:MAG: acylneuraminate cytidylyltransferase family protein [Bacteroidota bacterium]